MPPLDAQIKSNRRRSRALFGMFFLIYGALGFAVSLRFGPAAFYIFCSVAIVIVVVTLTMGDDLAVTVAHAKQLQSREECPPVWDAVEVMSIAAGQPMPRVYVSPDPAPNAFAAGKDPKQAVVCVNQGLLDILDKEELEGVVAHEMAHVRNLDVKLMTYAAVLAGILAGLPAVRIRLVVFDTQVVDLTHLAHDPVEVLLTVQLGGGTDIGRAVQYCETLVSQPGRTIF
ncbi:MAG: M48 family metalloprotease, partial [Solirubrobacterales bacterium]|nr:M48 family metalloprotease [Solirubrobacterales bacterium]